MLHRAADGSESSAASMEDRGGDQRKSQSSSITKRERAPQTSGRLACDICRERKVRCDRGDPKCGRCARLGYDCSYQGRRRYRAAQADMPRQLCELQNRLAHAEAILRTTSSTASTTTTARPITPQVDLSWPLMTPSERLSDHERLMQRLQSHVTPPMGRAFEGFDMLANLTEDIPDFWGVMDPALTPDALPILPGDTPHLPTPFESGYLTTGSGGSVAPAFESSLFASTHGLEEPISPSDLAALHHKYFDVFYPVLPILNQSRFHREWTHDPDSPRIRGLSYAVALIGATIAPEYAHLQSSCYSNARKYIELCERDDDETYIMSLNSFQALLFIVRYELTKKHFVRAWMTLGRAVTLAQILNLHRIDSGDTARQQRTGSQQDATETGLACDTLDPASLEETRRSFWSLYIFESYGSVRIGRPCTLEEDNLCIFLPSPGELSETFLPSPMPFISDSTKLTGVGYLTSYAAVTIMVKLARLCFEHVSILPRSASDSGFWDRHYRLVKTINDYTAIFQRYLTAKAVREDPLAFSLHLNLCATHINLHEAAIRKVEEQDLPKLVAAESRKCSTAAAFKILGAIRMNWPVQRSERDHFTLQATFIGWPISMSLIALSRSLANGDTTPIGIVDSLRLLCAALDHVEEADGYWHQASRAAVAALAKWDEQQHESRPGE
ncbi:fungal-specific transcription factor domain-containing protein [Aspergillus flavus]|uniref:Fungal-specific transcription factor domain-containing protein n=2 Tax=Aspergillus subgen. Circumdati TaxID=2720871 RepID=A0A5N6H6K4_ASPFL|nr:fungal-specific transcription factor domain-containing protein [Aspergillus flavus]